MTTFNLIDKFEHFLKYQLQGYSKQAFNAYCLGYNNHTKKSAITIDEYVAKVRHIFSTAGKGETFTFLTYIDRIQNPFEKASQYTSYGSNISAFWVRKRHKSSLLKLNVKTLMNNSCCPFFILYDPGNVPIDTDFECFARSWKDYILPYLAELSPYPYKTAYIRDKEQYVYASRTEIVVSDTSFNTFLEKMYKVNRHNNCPIRKYLLYE